MRTAAWVLALLLVASVSLGAQTTATGGGYYYVVTPQGDTLSQHSTQRAATDQLYYAMLLARREGRPTEGYRIRRELELRGDLSLFEAALSRVDTVEVRDTVWLGGGDTTVVVIRFEGSDSTVGPPPDPPPVGGMELLYSTGFEPGSGTPPAFEARGWELATGLGGSQNAIRATWAQGDVDVASWKIGIGKAPDSYRSQNAVGDPDRVYGELEYCLDVRAEGTNGDWPEKLARTAVFTAPGDWREAAVSHLWQGGEDATLGMDPVSTVAGSTVTATDYNDFDAFDWLGIMSHPAPVADGAVHGVCAYQRLNTPGQSDGGMALTIDGIRVERNDVDWRGAWDGGYGWNVLMLEGFWNAGAPGPASLTIDNLVIRGR